MTKRIIIPGGWHDINQVGQKVVCVFQLWSPCSKVLRLPVVGEIYTVEGFMDQGEPCPPEEKAGLFLKEISAPICVCRDAPLPFPLSAFRPVDTVEKKSAVVTEMLDDIMRKTKIDTRVPVDA